MDLSFGAALEAAERGERIARKGWNGRGIFVFKVSGGAVTPVTKAPNTPVLSVGPFLAIDTNGLQSDNPDAPRSVVPWLASQTDMLAQDWTVVA